MASDILVADHFRIMAATHEESGDAMEEKSWNTPQDLTVDLTFKDLQAVS